MTDLATEILRLAKETTDGFDDLFETPVVCVKAEVGCLDITCDIEPCFDTTPTSFYVRGATRHPDPLPADGVPAGEPTFDYQFLTLTAAVEWIVHKCSSIPLSRCAAIIHGSRRRNPQPPSAPYSYLTVEVSMYPDGFEAIFEEPEEHQEEMHATLYPTLLPSEKQRLRETLRSYLEIIAHARPGKRSRL